MAGVTRRVALTGLAASAAVSVAPALGQDRGARDVDAPFAPVKATPERVIRTVVGLRPYRAAGFRLETERLGRWTVVHNYGHGGAGVTLSWGCAELAAFEALKAGGDEVVVIGAGVIGLTTARLLQQAGADVILVAEAFPPETTSNIAGALWFPTTLYDRDVAGPQFDALLHRVARRSFRRFQHFVNDPNYGVFWIRHHYLRSGPPRRPTDPLPGGDDLYPGLKRNQDGAGPFGFTHWDAYYTLMIDPDIFLRALMNDFEAAGGRLVQTRLDSPNDLAKLKRRTFVNCTGLGAGVLFGDDALTPARGQLSLLLPQPEIDYGYSTGVFGGATYMFPRRSAIVLGGSVDHGESELTPDPELAARMLAKHAELAARLT